MYVLGPSIQLRPATVSSSVQIASMKEEKELSPREGICFLAPKMRWEEREEGRKRKRNGQAERQIQISERHVH